MSPRVPVLVGVVLLLAPLPASAQDACAPQTGRYHLRPDPEMLVVPALTAGDLEEGEVDAGAVSVAIVPRGNASRDWRLCLRAVRPTIGPGGKGASDIEFLPGSGGTWTPLSAFDQVIARGRGRSDVEIRFRIRVDWSDEPGSYESLLALTLVAD